MGGNDELSNLMSWRSRWKVSPVAPIVKLAAAASQIAGEIKTGAIALLCDRECSDLDYKQPDQRDQGFS